MSNIPNYNIDEVEDFDAVLSELAFYIDFYSFKLDDEDSKKNENILEIIQDLEKQMQDLKAKFPEYLL